VLWEFATSGRELAAPALDTEGNVYVPSPANKLHAIDRQGRQKWQFATPDSHFQYASAVIGRNGTIYLATFPFLYALSASGQELWRAEGADMAPPALSAAGTIYVSSRGLLTALGTNGARIWTFAFPGSSEGPPVIKADGTVYAVIGAQFPNPDPCLYGDHTCSTNVTVYVLCGFSQQGTPVWTSDRIPWTGCDWGGPGWGWAAVAPDGTILMNSAAYRPAGPEPPPYYLQDWWMPPTAGIGSPPFSVVIGNTGGFYYGGCDQSVYFGGSPPSDGTPYLHAVNPDGSLKWEVPVEGGLLGAAVDAQENIYFGTGKGKFLALDGQGNTLWQLDLGSAVGIPTLGPDGVIYVGTAAGKVFAIKVAAGPGASPWPQFQRNAQHTGSMESYLTISKSRQLSLAGIPTRAYRIEFSDTLANPRWRALTNVTLATDTQSFPDLLPTNSAGGFYRAVLLP